MRILDPTTPHHAGRRVAFPVIEYIFLPHAEGLPEPFYATKEAACFDVFAAVPETIVLAPQRRVTIPLGLTLRFPAGYEVQIRARSGLAHKSGIMLVNGIGTIDSDYPGELGAILYNSDHETPFKIERGARIAQCALVRSVRARMRAVERFSRAFTGDRAGGFGSTGQ